MVKAHGYTEPIVLASSQELDQFVYVITLLEQLNVKNDSNSSIELESLIHMSSIFYHNWTLCGLNKETSA
ncbi:hypothetical protein PDQ79_25250 [Bacillus cereus]|nr:hypothetical protein [Bacillus cereus]